MSMLKVRAALAKAFVDGSYFPAADVAWENVAFTPRQGNKPWAQWFFLPNQPVVATLGEGGLDQVDGIVQVDLNYPTGNGDGDAMAKYAEIRDDFKAGTRLTYDGQGVKIRSCGRSQGRLVGGYYRVSVTITFFAQVSR